MSEIAKPEDMETLHFVATKDEARALVVQLRARLNSTGRSFYFTDVNGDGHADKLFWRPNNREGRIQVYLGSATGFAGAPLMDNTGWSQSSNTGYFFADLDGSGAADKVYWNPGANDGGSRAYLSRY